jgi:hypothetical protein
LVLPKRHPLIIGAPAANKVFDTLASGAKSVEEVSRKQMFAVNMPGSTENSDTYSFNEIKHWLEEAGFENARTLQAPGPARLVLATKL